MDKTLFFPSPNWFLASNFAVSSDGWIVYGGPRKSLCVVEPIDERINILAEKQSYKVHMSFKGHNEKVVSVNISPEFVKKRNLLSGAADGSVKQWTLEKAYDSYNLKCTHSHEIHLKEKEAIIGVGYSTESIAITVGVDGNIVKWDLSSNVCKTYKKLLAAFKPTCMSCSPHTALNVAFGTKQGVVFALDLTGDGKILYKVRSQDDEITNLSWCPQYEIQVSKQSANAKLSALPESKPTEDKANTSSDLNESHLKKDLPQDSFEASSCQEDDMFDIYKDHEADEFGHKKYVPEDIVVKTEEKKSEDTSFLEECWRLRDEILKKKKLGEELTLEALVDAMDKARVGCSSTEDNSTSSEATASGSEIAKSKETNIPTTLETYKHVLATIGRLGTVRLLNNVGIMLASCIVSHFKKDPRTKVMGWPSILWATTSSLLVVDGKSQLVECNPLKIDRHNKLGYRVVHAQHKRGLYAIATDAPRVQPIKQDPLDPNCHGVEDWSVYSVSQDRNIVRFSMKDEKPISFHNTCGGYVYNVQFCPYDAGKMALGVGDGAIRVLDSTMLESNKLLPGKVRSYWQNVQGKVLSVAWHPTEENLLAFGTAESRVGLLNVGGSGERPAQVLQPLLTGGVYSLCWGSDKKLFAVGGNQLVMYDANTPEASPAVVSVEADGQALAAGAVAWSPRGLLVGSHKGAVAILHPHNLNTLGVAYFYNKMVYMMEWHPVQVSKSTGLSPHDDLIAVCSSDKSGNITIVQVKDKKGGRIKELSTLKVLSGHKKSVLQLVWSPHREELLLSTSSDGTVRVWNFVMGMCLSEFAGHGVHTLGAAWLPQPRFACYIVSGGADYCLRLWNYRRHTAVQRREATVETHPSNPLMHTRMSGLSPTTTFTNRIDWGIQSQLPAPYPSPIPTFDEQIALMLNEHVPRLCKQPLKAQLVPPETYTIPKGTRAEEQVTSLLNKHVANLSKEALMSQLATSESHTSPKCTVEEQVAAMSIEQTSPKDNLEAQVSAVSSEQTSPKDNIEEQVSSVLSEPVPEVSKEESKPEPVNPVSQTSNGEEQVAAVFRRERLPKVSKKHVLPLVTRQMNLCEIASVNKAFKKFVEKKPDEIDDGPDFVNVFGSVKEINQVLDKEMTHLIEADLLEGWVTLSLLRGQIESTMDFAIQRDMLCPYLVNMASCVSLKYMKEVTQAYIAQIDRFVAKQKEDKLCAGRNYGGAIYKKVTLMLCIHDVKAAVDVLTEAKLYKEAYILCRLRFMNAIAESILEQWAQYSCNCGNFNLAAICYMVLGNLHEASTVLEKSLEPEALKVAANLARLSGSNIFATHIEDKAQNITSKTDASVLDSTGEEKLPKPLKELPSRVDLILKEAQGCNYETDNSDEDDDDIGHDFVNLQYEEVLQNIQ